MPKPPIVATKMAAASSSTDPRDPAEALRFEAELEFVQSLANPEYLHFLAQNRYFDDPRFVDYIEYLRYWREPPYCLHIAFPHCLRMLELLQTDKKFVEALKRADFKDFLRIQQHWHWRTRALPTTEEEKPQEEEATATAAAAAADAPEAKVVKR